MRHQLNNFCKLFSLVLFAGLFVVGTRWALPAKAQEAKPPAAIAEKAKPQDSPAFDQAAALAALRQGIAADKDKPAEQVFKNIQFFKGVPAGRLLAIMELGYSRSLGVTCTHCHTPGAWEKEDLNTKQIARDMAAMTKTINEQSLKNIKNLKGARPTVNCTTCHRGQTTPALNLPENKPKM